MSEREGRGDAWTDERGREERAPERGGKASPPGDPEASGGHSGELDPVIHAPVRLRIVVTLAALRDGDNLSFTRLQDLIGLTPGNLVTHLRKLEDAGYVSTHKNGSGVTARTSVELTNGGRAALDQYTAVLRGLLDSAGGPAPDPGT
jgi:DNA-binding transcriptional ArsR family regulator